MVERRLAKANVASSNLVFRSMVPSPSGKAKVCKTFIPSSNWVVRLQNHMLMWRNGRRKGLKSFVRKDMSVPTPNHQHQKNKKLRTKTKENTKKILKANKCICKFFITVSSVTFRIPFSILVRGE